MPRKKLTKTKAREMANSPKRAHRGGRPRKPTPCPKCTTLCDSYRKAQAHC